MGVAWWKPKATNTYSDHVIIIALPPEEWLHKRLSMLRYDYIARLVSPKVMHEFKNVSERELNVLLHWYVVNFVLYNAWRVPVYLRANFILSCSLSFSVALRGRFMWLGFYSSLILGTGSSRMVRALHQLLGKGRHLVCTMLNNKVGRKRQDTVYFIHCNWWCVSVEEDVLGTNQAWSKFSPVHTMKAYGGD
jgi:hypothetical protein